MQICIATFTILHSLSEFDISFNMFCSLLESGEVKATQSKMLFCRTIRYLTRVSRLS